MIVAYRPTAQAATVHGDQHMIASPAIAAALSSLLAVALAVTACGGEEKTDPGEQTPGHWTSALGGRVNALIDAGKFEQASKLIETELRVVTAKYGNTDEHVAIAYGMLADVQTEAARPKASAERRLKQLEALEARGVAGDEIIRVVGQVYSSYLAARRADLARPYIDRQIEALEAKHGATSKTVAEKLEYIGALLAMADEHAEAVEYFRRAMSAFEGNDARPNDRAKQVAAHLLTSLEKLDRREEAVALKKRYTLPD